MQGSLAEVDLYSLLRLIVQGQHTGILWLVTEPQTPPMAPRVKKSQSSNFLAFERGRIVFGSNLGERGSQRLQDYCDRYPHITVDEAIAPPAFSPPDYAGLTSVLIKKQLAPQQVQTILRLMIQETLFDLFQGNWGGQFHFETNLAISPRLFRFPLEPILVETQREFLQWRQLAPHITSPDQHLILADEPSLRSGLSPLAYQRLARWTDGKTSFRRLSRRLHRPLITLAQGIYPYIERGWLRLSPTPSIPFSKPVSSLPEIISLTPNGDLAQHIAKLLSTYPCHHYPFSDLSSAFAQILTHQPNLLICDTVLTPINGYELCRSLKTLPQFQPTSVILLAEQFSFGDRLQAHQAGATKLWSSHSLTPERLQTLL